jgi:copper chaperone CopZ
MASEHVLKVEGMHCESCEKIISRTVAKHEGAHVKGFDLQENKVRIFCSDEQLPKIKKELLAKGYQLLLPGDEAQQGYEAGSLSRVMEFASGLISGKEGFVYEHKLLQYAIISLILIFAAQLAIYFVVFGGEASFLRTYGSILSLSALSVVAVIFAFYHARIFRKQTSCMTGMMTGMTVGMMGGFMIGAFIGATNGMFIGSLAGMAFGMFLGFEAGRCCGVMGGMEGLMGGLMAGTMGAMLSVMMVYDNLMPFLYILSGVCLAILGGLAYMIYKEYGSIEQEQFDVSAAKFLFYSLILYLAVAALAIFGPKANVVLG